MKKSSFKEIIKSKILIISIVCGILICTAMFIGLGVYVNSSTTKTVNEAGEMFMAGIGRQSVLRYNAVIDQRITMIKGLDQTYPSDAENVNEHMGVAAAARDFDYLAYMDADGNLEMVLGENLEINDPEPFIASMRAHESKAAVASTESGSEHSIIVIGVYTADAYYMQNGNRSLALIGGLKNTVITDMLSENNSNNSDAQRYETHIIRRDGSFVIRGTIESDRHSHSSYTNYYNYITGTFGMPEQESQSLINDIQTNMNDGKILSTVINSGYSRKHLYMEKIANSEWHLVMVMKYKDIDEIVNGLSGSITTLFTIISIIMIAILIGIFCIYVVMNKRTLKQLADAKIAAEKANKSKSEFLSNMSHDIRTPMNAIVGMTAIATANIDNKQQVSDCLKKISLSSRHLLGLINDVLDMSKIESGKLTLNMEKISLSEVTEGIATIVQPQIKIKRQKFDIHVHDIISEDVYCDSVRLNQVMLNLLSNAYKFTPDEGKIELSLWQEPSGLGDKYVRTHITVKDSGIGMSEDFQKKIFESFTREDNTRVHKIEGTGLGMSITKYIVDAMHGTIDVKSKLGEGTEFHITVDLEKADADDSEMILPPWRMLVVDDDVTLCETAIASLSEIGVTAEAAYDGETAIETAINAHARGADYDIILVDWKLPGIDGVETAKRLRKNLGNVPILIISAYDWAEIEKEARNAGVNGFISKPLFKSSLFYGLKQFSSETAETENEKSGDKFADLNGKHLLVAEDNDLNWEIASLLLEDAGLKVDRAEDGQICVDMLKNSPAGTYDAILMDLRMPVMNGIEAAKIIRTLEAPYGTIPIIAMTADAFSDDIKKCLDAGMNAHIAKPIDIDAVKATLLKFIFDKK